MYKACIFDLDGEEENPEVSSCTPCRSYTTIPSDSPVPEDENIQKNLKKTLLKKKLLLTIQKTDCSCKLKSGTTAPVSQICSCSAFLIFLFIWQFERTLKRNDPVKYKMFLAAVLRVTAEIALSYKLETVISLAVF